MSHSRSGSYEISVVAETGEQFSDFQPYVASINDQGVIAFQAKVGDGASGVYALWGGSIRTVVETPDDQFGAIVSHPDIDAGGSAAFYATTKSGGHGVYLARGGELKAIADAHGPLGPTINDAGAIAFRAERSEGVGAIFTHTDGATRLVADLADRFAEFHGLPVINGAGAIVLRADLAGGGQGIYVASGEAISTAVETGDRFRDLGHFPVLIDDGTVGFVGTLRDGQPGVFTVRDGTFATIVDAAHAAFRSFRGVLLQESGPCVFYATALRVGARLGIFSGPDPVADRLLGIGSSLLGSTVTDFALNPVSINRHGQLAIRVRLADNRQLILRADPPSS